MSQVKHKPIDDGNDGDIRSIEGSERTLETTSFGSTIGDENAQGNEDNSMNALLEAKMQLEKLTEAEEKTKPIIQEIQKKVDESAKEMATLNEKHRKQKQELEEKHQKRIAVFESKNWERNANFAKEMANLKEQLKDKINWNQVDLVMGKKLAVSPIASAKGNCWDFAQTNKCISISTDGLKATNNSNANRFESVCAEEGFHISADPSGPVIFYFEVTNMSSYKWIVFVGLASGNIPNGSFVGRLPNSYAIEIEDGCDRCWLSGNLHDFEHNCLSCCVEWPNDAIKLTWKGQGDVIGCGLLLNSKNKWAIFFTLNGLLIGKQISINPTANPLYPTVTMEGNASVEANFGDDSAKPFKYDIDKCPGIVFK